MGIRMPPKSKIVKKVDKSNLNGSRILIEKAPRKLRKSLRSEGGEKAEEIPSVLETNANPKRRVFKAEDSSKHIYLDSTKCLDLKL
jgi:hypothetical protein